MSHRDDNRHCSQHGLRWPELDIDKCTCEPDETSNDEALLAAIRNGSWLDVQNFPALQYAIPGIIPEGFALLAGPPKAGKSWLILSFLLAIATGGAALGKIPLGDPRRVLYLALEDGDRRMQDRCRAVLGDAPIPGLFDYITRVETGTVVSLIEAYMRRRPETALVVIDTLGKVMPPAAQGETTYQRDYRVGGRLKAISDTNPGLALVALHHDRKAESDDFVERVSGTNGLAGAADSIIILSRKRKAKEGVLAVTGRDVHEDEYALLMSADGAWMLDGDTLAEASARVEQRQENALSDTTSDVLTYIRAAGPGGAATKDLVDKFGKDVYTYLARQVDAGRLTKPKRGLYIASGLTDNTVRSVSLSETQVGQSRASDTSDTTSEPTGKPLTSLSDTSDTSDTPPWEDSPLCDGCAEQMAGGMSCPYHEDNLPIGDAA